MKRRDLLKGLSLTAGAALVGRAGPAWPAAGRAAPAFAVPIRGLVRRDGQLLQPIRINLPKPGLQGTAVTRIDGAEVDRRAVAPGTRHFDVLLPPARARTTATVSTSLGADSWTARVELAPVRHLRIYVLPHSHHDLGYTDVQAHIEEKQIRNIARGIELARQTAGYPEGARFVWNLEVLWGADLYLRRSSPAERQALLEAIGKGWIGLNGSYANELTGLCRPEELLQLFRYGTTLARRSGVRLDAAMFSDVPGYTWGTVAAMAQAGIRYFSAAPNSFDRIGRFMATWQDRPFWWLSRSGKEKVLFWVPWHGYALSHGMQEPDEFWVGDYQARMDDVNFPYDISYIRWSGHGDNAEPDPGISEFVKSWNTAYEWPQFAIASTSTAFAAFEQRHGGELPQLRGDLTPYWEDGAGSSARETAINRNAASRLVQASALAAMNGGRGYAPATFAQAWRDVLLYSEHTWGAAASISEPDSEMTRRQWDGKRAFAEAAERRSQALLAQAWPAGAAGRRVDVINTTSWQRRELVLLPPSLSAAGDRVTDERGGRVPSQRLAGGELAILASVPAFAAVRYTISAGAAHHEGEAVTIGDGVLRNAALSLRLDPQSGDIVELALRGDGHNLVDAGQGLALNRFLFLHGDDLAHLGRSGPATIVVEDRGPLVATVRIESAAPGCRSLVRRVRLAAGQDAVELSNTVDKLRAPFEPVPGKPPRVAKESLQFAFPFALPGGRMELDIPLSQMQPERDQLPGSCKNWLPVGRWASIANDTHAVTWATLDAPLVEIGGITATKLNSQTDPEAWLRQLAPAQTLLSWVMNNHWGTNYRAYQEGPVTFRYAVQARRAADAGAGPSGRFGTALAQPLLAVAAAEGPAPSATSFLQVEPADVVVETLKPSDDGKAWIVRLFGASGLPRTARLEWSAAARAGRTWLSNLAEEPLAPAASGITVAGWELVTLRVERRLG